MHPYFLNCFFKILHTLCSVTAESALQETKNKLVLLSLNIVSKIYRCVIYEIKQFIISEQFILRKVQTSTTALSSILYLVDKISYVACYIKVYSHIRLSF